MTLNQNRSIYRILDANINRASEGLRTIEEYFRFVLDDESLSQQLKSLRHDFVDVLAGLDRQQLLESRDTQSDVGTSISVATEDQRPDTRSVVVAAIQRVQQALRCIEEYSKIVSIKVAKGCESIRYRFYDLAVIVETKLEPNRQASFLVSARLYVLVDCHDPIDVFYSKVREISQAGVDLIQVREKKLEAKHQIEYIEKALEAVEGSSTQVLVNDRADLAAVTGVAGVHLGQTDLPPKLARTLLGRSKSIGLSTHSIDQAQQALELAEVDYLGCGPTFPSSTKSFDSFAGLDYLRQVSQLGYRKPAFAIGGIQLDNLDRVLDAGFDRIAVSSCVWKSNDPGKVAMELAERLRRGAAV